MYEYIVENQSTLNAKEYDMAPMFGDSKDSKLYSNALSYTPKFKELKVFVITLLKKVILT
jgi:hypothetical protein